MPSSPPHGADLLHATQSDADRRDRELMNLKMEIAHLRERLLLRVGGDASAAALEAENFALKTSLADAQADAARATQTLQTLDVKYAKALKNLVKMDQAWKSSAAALQAAKKDIAAKEESMLQQLDEMEQLKKAHEEDIAKRQTLVGYQEEKITALEASLHTKEAELASHVDQLHKFTFKTKELESELEATRTRYESNTQQSIPRDKYDTLQTQHQEAMEANAALRGETNALREECSSLQTQVSETKASLTAAMAKFLQLKKDNATLEVRVAAANEKSEQCERDATFFKGEVDRIQHELTKRDEVMLQLERAKQVLELQLTQQQRRVEDAVQVRDQEAKRLELKQELTWKDREFALEKEVRQLKKKCEALQSDADNVRLLHEELCKMLRHGGHDDDAVRAEGSDLKLLVAHAVEQLSEAAFTDQQQLKQIAHLEKEMAQLTSLAEENATLKAEYEKTRLAMERIVGRKSKATANTHRFTAATAPSSSAAVSFRKPTTTVSPATRSTPPTNPLSSMLSQQRRPSADKENKTTVSGSTYGTKRKLELPPSVDTGNRPPTSDTGVIFSPRSKRVVHVASRYMQAASARR